MIARVAHVITCASACRCFEASERTSASVSRAFASIRPVILAPSQVASRVSKIVPVTSRTISRPLPRAHKATLGRGLAVKNISLHHCRTATGDYHRRLQKGLRQARRRFIGTIGEALVALRIRGSLDPATIALVVPACARDCDAGCSGPRPHLTIGVSQVMRHDTGYPPAGTDTARSARRDASGVSGHDLRNAQLAEMALQPASLEAPLYGQPGASMVADLLGEEDQQMEQILDMHRGPTHRRALSPREQEILLMRFYDGMTH